MVTSVGGTTGGASSEQPEVANSLSGGGFSIYFDRPDYQFEATETFLESDGTFLWYSDFYRYIISRELTQPTLTM